MKLKILRAGTSLLLAAVTLLCAFAFGACSTAAEPKPAIPDPNADTSPDSPVGYYGELMVSGSSIVAEKTGRPAQVTGMSFFWSNWSGKYYDAKYVDRMVDEFDCEIVRAAYGIQGAHPYKASDEERICKLVEAAIDRDIYVIIDWHSHDAHTDPTDAVAFFSRMAEKYGMYDNVIFELYNEPTQVSWNDVKTYAETVLPVIRKHSDNLVIVGSPTWSQDVDKAAADPIDDPNVAYTLHFYAGTHKEWLRDRADRAMDSGIALFVTEWGSCNADGNGAIDYASALEWINWCNENGISMCNWAVNDKEETSSVFFSDGSLTEAGLFLSTVISERTALSEWRTGEPYVFAEQTYAPPADDVAPAA